MNKLCGVLILLIMFMAGCGGGGSDNTGSVKATKVKLVYATSGVLSTGDLSGISVTLQLPPGVTPTLAANGAVDSVVVAASGVLANNSMPVIPMNYSPANGATLATLNFLIASKSGFGIGEFATVTLNIAADAVQPVHADFKVLSYSTIDSAYTQHDNPDSLAVTFTLETI